MQASARPPPRGGQARMLSPRGAPRGGGPGWEVPQHRAETGEEPASAGRQTVAVARRSARRRVQRAERSRARRSHRGNPEVAAAPTPLERHGRPAPAAERQRGGGGGVASRRAGARTETDEALRRGKRLSTVSRAVRGKRNGVGNGTVTTSARTDAGPDADPSGAVERHPQGVCRGEHAARLHARRGQGSDGRAQVTELEEVTRERGGRRHGGVPTPRKGDEGRRW
jgi:hypothetical protein